MAHVPPSPGSRWTGKRLFRFTSRSRRDIAGDLRDEIDFHLETRAGELVERGMSPADAMRQARREFGDIEGTTVYCQRLDLDKEKRMRVLAWIDELRQDLAFGARLLIRQPGQSALALLTVALGVGATTLVFGVVYASLLAPLPYREADRLMVVRLSLPDYDDVRRSVDAIEDSGVFASNLYILDEEQVLGGVVTPGFFTTLGVAPIAGRAIQADDGRTPVVVLGEGLWRRRYGGDPSIVGRTLILSGTAYTIVGVMPAGFRFPSSRFELWTSLEHTMTIVPEQHTNRALRIFQAVVRLRPDVTPTHAQAALTALAQRLASVHPDTNEGIGLQLVSVRDRLFGDVRTALLVALGAVGCLLFIACVNVASLTLARLTARTQELAVRAAIGAGRWRMARQLAAESLLTAVCGGLVGVAIAAWGLSAVAGLAGDRIPRVDEASLSLPVLAVALAAVAAAALLVALVPIVQLSITQLDPALRAGPRGGGEVRFGMRLRSGLVVAQIGVAVVVLSGAMMLTRSLGRLLDADTGFRPDGLLTFNLPLIEQPTREARAAAVARTFEAIARLPGVRQAAGGTALAPITAQRGTSFEIEGRSDVPADQRSGYFIAASPGYLEALGTRLLAGREFTANDRDASPLVAMVSETLARRFFADRNAVGRRLRLVNPEQSGEWRTIVGVVSNVRYNGLDDANPPVVYTAFAQTPFPWIYGYVRTDGDPAALVGAVRRAVKSVDPRLPVANPQPMTALMAESSADPRFRSTLAALFACVAVLLAAAGLYGVVAFGVARRAREIAIRVALGASAGSVRWSVLKQSLTLALCGVGLGLAGAVWLGGVLAEMLYEIQPGDPVSLVAVAGVLVLVAVAAGVAPASRAARIDPVEALREG